MSEDVEELEAKYQIVIPFILRGFLIHLMNDTLDKSEFLHELMIINRQLASMLNCYKEAGTSFERYLT